MEESGSPKWIVCKPCHPDLIKSLSSIGWPRVSATAIQWALCTIQPSQAWRILKQSLWNLLNFREKNSHSMYVDILEISIMQEYLEWPALLLSTQQPILKSSQLGDDGLTGHSDLWAIAHTAGYLFGHVLILIFILCWYPVITCLDVYVFSPFCLYLRLSFYCLLFYFLKYVF